MFSDSDTCTPMKYILVHRYALTWSRDSNEYKASIKTGRTCLVIMQRVLPVVAPVADRCVKNCNKFVSRTILFQIKDGMPLSMCNARGNRTSILRLSCT